MFCRICGTQLPTGAGFCPHCGTPTAQHQAQCAQPQYPVQQPQYIAAPMQNTTNSIAVVGFVLSFFVPIAGLICSIFGLIKTGKGAPYKGLAIAGIVISAVWMVVQFFLTIIPLMRYMGEILGFFLILPLIMLFAISG